MKKTALLTLLSLCSVLAFGQVSDGAIKSYEKDPVYKKNGKRKNGIYISLIAGLNSHVGSATLKETSDISMLASTYNEYELNSLPGANLGMNLEIDFGTHSSLYIEPQFGLDNASYIDNDGESRIVSTATIQAKMLFGYDLGAMRQFTFKAGAGMLAYAIPVIDASLSQEPGVDDITIVPSMYLGMEWNATQWLMFGLEHRRLFNFPNEMSIHYSTLGEVKSYNYQISNFRLYMRLRLMLIRYR